MRHCGRLIFAFFGISLSAFANAQQPWSGILSSSRAINWANAGLPATLPDGETTTNPWSPPTRTQCGSTVAAGTSVATLNSLFAACANGTYLLLGAGDFTINSQLDLWERASRCVAVDLSPQRSRLREARKSRLGLHLVPEQGHSPPIQTTRQDHYRSRSARFPACR